MTRVIDLAVAPGDGIGQEVVPEALRVLDVIEKRFDVEFRRTEYDLGWRMYVLLGDVLPDDVMDLL